MMDTRESALNHQFDRLPEGNTIKIIYKMNDTLPDQIKERSAIYRAFESKLYKDYQNIQGHKGKIHDSIQNKTH